MKTQNTTHVAALTLLMVVTALVIGGCDKPLTQVEPDEDDDRIIVLTTNQLIHSENSVLVNGEVVFRKQFRPDSSIYFHDESIYTYHTEFGDIRTGWIHNGISFTAELNKAPQLDPRVPGFKFVFDNLDLGELTLNGIPMNALTADNVDFGETPDSLLEIKNLKSYWYHVFQATTNSQGNTFVDLDTPLKQAYEAGTVMTLAGSGAPEVEDFSIGFTAKQVPNLSAVASGTELDFRDEIPRISAQNDLVLGFDRPLKAGESFLTLIPLPSEGNSVNYADVKEKAAFVSIVEDTDEVIIGSDVLRQLKANSDVTSEGYSLSIYTFAQGRDLTFNTVPGSDVESYTFPVFTEGIIDMFVIFLP